MNRIENKLAAKTAANEKAFITYMTAGLPDMEGTKALIRAQEEAGTDVLELGVPFSDPVADGPVIQNASYQSLLKGTNVKMIFKAVSEVREDGCELPIVFMMYYNTVLHYGIKPFVEQCIKSGVDGLIIPDLPFEEQKELCAALAGSEDSPILIQLVSPVSKQRIPMILEHARGFVYCVSSMGVTGQDGGFHKNVVNYLKEVKAVAKIPVMMGFGIKEAKDVAAVHDIIDGCIVGSHFIRILEKSNYDTEAAKAYIRKFKEELNA